LNIDNDVLSEPFQKIIKSLLNKYELFLYKVTDYDNMKVSSKPTFRYNDNAVSPIIGTVLILLLTFVLAVATVAAVYNDGAVERIGNSLSKTPTAMIEIEGIVGGIQSEPNTIRFDQNYITLMHKSGDSLDTSSTNIILSGYGSSFVGMVGNTGNHMEYGDSVVRYTDLTPNDKNTSFLEHNTVIDDGLWSTGEKLILWGRDSSIGNGPSTVLVTVNGISNTSDNYGFKSGTTVTIKIFDKITQRIIAEGTAIVKPAE